jgi:hypothetical protein
MVEVSGGAETILLRTNKWHQTLEKIDKNEVIKADQP